LASSAWELIPVASKILLSNISILFSTMDHHP
jgi:hypothetical protein